MKAFSCPQCGALLEDVSIEKNIARCDYCGAKILLRPIGEIKDDGEQEFEVSLVTRAESGIEEKETYKRQNLTYTKHKYQVNESLHETLKKQPIQLNESTQNASSLPYLIGLVIIVLVGVVIYLTR